MKAGIYKPSERSINMEGGIARIFTIFQKINGREIDLRQYDDRLNLQKLTYLLKSAKVDFGYRFSWYVKGPYSPPLATDAFAYWENSVKETVELTGNEQKTIQALQAHFGDELTQPDKLELYASLLFIKRNEQIALDDAETLASRLTSLKPWFFQTDALRAIRKLRESGLFE